MKASLLNIIRWVNSWSAHHVGISVMRTGSGLTRHKLDDPRLIDYIDTGHRADATFLTPLAKASCFQIALGPASIHPWVVALKRGLSTGLKSDVARVLESYYSQVVPRDAAEWLDVPAERVPGLHHTAPHAAVLPWSTLDPSRAADRQESIHLRENRRYGLEEGVLSGHKAYGPLNRARLEMETDRLWRLARSISESGLITQRRDYTLSGDFLFNHDRFRALVRGGGHRAAVAAAVGIDVIPLTISSVIRREEVSIWPQVAAGVYDDATALTVFDRLLEGRLPGVMSAWSSSVG